MNDLTIENIKPKLIEHLKGQYINNDIYRLWGETKYWFKKRLIEHGGGYASFGSKITIWTYINNEKVYFKISLEEVK